MHFLVDLLVVEISIEPSPASALSDNKTCSRREAVRKLERGFFCVTLLRVSSLGWESAWESNAR